ncbi:unnamed protein product [Aphanomyces euteiches]
MPKAKLDINYSRVFILETIEEWEQVKGTTTQRDFADMKNIKLRTLRSWLDKKKRDKIGKTTSQNEIARLRPSENAEITAKMETFIQENPEVSTIERVEYLKRTFPNFVASRSYDNLRRFAERIEKKNDFSLTANIMLEAAASKRVFKPCRCGKKCGPKCTNRLDMVECTDNICHVGKNCGNRVFQSGVVGPISTFQTENTGVGVMSTEKISKGTFLCEYIGEIISAVAGKSRQDRHRDIYLMKLADGRFIDSFQVGNISRFINYSHASNAVAHEWIVNGIRRVGIFAKKNIKRNEEVTFNYGKTYSFAECKCEKCARKSKSLDVLMSRIKLH